jgi:hypothetical protein
MSFTPDHEIVITGVLRRWETGTITTEAGGQATAVSKALHRLLDEVWSIVMFDRAVVEKGAGVCFNYENKWWVYGVRTTKCNYDNQAILAFLDNRFGWASIGDIGKLQASAEAAVNEKFEGRWRVHAAKLPAGALWLWEVFGGYWEHDEHYLWVMRES